MRPTRAVVGLLFFSLIGIGLSAYLFFLHLGLLRGEFLGGAVCGGSGAFNCHVVSGGSWGQFLGMPLALWGVLGYAAVFALALFALQSNESAQSALTLIFALALLFLAIDLALLSLMVFVIRYYCLLCLLTYAVNLALLVVSASALAHRWSDALGQLGPSLGAVLMPSAAHPSSWLVWGILLAAGFGAVGVHAATNFVIRGSGGSLQKQIRDFATHQPRVTVEVAGDPRLGPDHATLQLVEFSDFFCPACQRASKMNSIILASHRRDVAFIFKHYPLDSSCNSAIQRMVHPGACTVAAASECVHQQGKFWAFHDLLFEQGHAYKLAGLDEDVQRLGVDLTQFRACMDSGAGMEAVKRDIAEGARIGIASTPTYVINGLSVSGGLTPTTFEEFVAALRGTGE